MHASKVSQDMTEEETEAPQRIRPLCGILCLKRRGPIGRSQEQAKPRGPGTVQKSSEPYTR